MTTPPDIQKLVDDAIALKSNRPEITGIINACLKLLADGTPLQKEESTNRIKAIINMYTKNNWWVLRLGAGEYMSLALDYRPAANCPIEVNDPSSNTKTTTIGPGNWQIVYGPVSIDDAREFLNDVQGT